jgi:hypothetical protein
MKQFVLIEIDPAVVASNEGRPKITQLDDPTLRAHVFGYVSPCCIDARPGVTAWLDSARPGDVFDAIHYDDEIYVCTGI